MGRKLEELSDNEEPLNPGMGRKGERGRGGGEGGEGGGERCRGEKEGGKKTQTTVTILRRFWQSI